MDVLLMWDHGILKKIMVLSREKPVFLLSDVIPVQGKNRYTPDDMDRLQKELLPEGLLLEKEGNDYKISRTLPKKQFILSGDDQKRVETFLRSPAVPPYLQQLIEEFIGKKTGKQWNDPLTLERIRAAVIAQKGEYWKEGKKKRVHYEQGYRVLAYLAYQFPGYFVQFEHILMMLALSGLLKEDMAILDAGSGPGVSALALMDFLRRTGNCSADLYAIENSAEQREAYTFLTSGYAEGVNGVHIRPPVAGDLRVIPPDDLPRGIDLLIFQNVLNELTSLTLEQKAKRVTALSAVLSAGGVMVISEPADMANSIALRQLVQELSRQGMTVIAPCPPVGPRTCRTDRCWSFVEKPPVRSTRLMEAVSAHPEAYRFINTDIKYSYAVLVKATNVPTRMQDLCGKKTAKLSGLSRHVDRRINVCAAVMSDDLGNEKTHLWKLCDGSQQKPVYAVMPTYHKTPDNVSLITAGYGEYVEISGVLVRYNPHYDSFNLLVTRNTQVSVRGKRKSHAPGDITRRRDITRKKER
jgi:hypothetical protein